MVLALAATQRGDRLWERVWLAGTVLFGKVMPGAAELASTMASLGQALVAPVVGVAPGQQVVVLADAGRRSLGPAATNPQLRAGGRLLARLHARPGPPGPVLTRSRPVQVMPRQIGT